MLLKLFCFGCISSVVAVLLLITFMCVKEIIVTE